uniref:Uncharacterized protein n=1 Tax=Rhizophora mucronata TaxID=61149 RepID=A0A2P2P736_RHIMU
MWGGVKFSFELEYNR